MFNGQWSMVNGLKSKLFGLIVALLCCACEGDYPYSRRYACHLMLKYELHPTSLAFAAVKSPGMYVSITTKGDGRTTVRHVYITSNETGTTTEDIIIRSDDENYRTFQLGRSNETGLIVGCTNFNGPVAYDRSCPNCESLQPLMFTGNRQQVACSACKRTYMLDTGAIISGDDGQPLLLYSCQFNGTWLIVTNGVK
jgi:nitrite reductase/ring-hydroxylating ferredoxin subunit